MVGIKVYYFSIMIERSGSWRPKNMWIRIRIRIRIRNTGEVGEVTEPLTILVS
jgi:hypothetical protein